MDTVTITDEDVRGCGNVVAFVLWKVIANGDLPEDKWPTGNFPLTFEVNLTVNGHGMPIVKVLEMWNAEMERFIREKALELVQSMANDLEIS